jgi:hypothetical protein
MSLLYCLKFKVGDGKQHQSSPRSANQNFLAILPTQTATSMGEIIFIVPSFISTMKNFYGTLIIWPKGLKNSISARSA